MGNIELLSSTMPDLLPWTHRAPGPHVSSVIHSLAVALGHYDPRDANMMQMQLGCALEHAVIQRYLLDAPQRYWQLGELCVDGLTGTMDLFDAQDWAPHEFKLSWRSSRDIDIHSTKYWSNRTQLQAYMHMIGATTGRLEVAYVNGDYSYGKGERVAYRKWELSYPADELISVWTMLTNHAATLRCNECAGSGQWHSATLTLVGACHACNGSGVKLTEVAT